MPDDLQASLEQALADNAALLAALQRLARGKHEDESGNAPGHAHSEKPKHWDSDNIRFGLAGKPCEWCNVEWPRIKAALTQPHPGAALLREVLALRRVRQGAEPFLRWVKHGLFKTHRPSLEEFDLLLNACAAADAAREKP